MATLRTTLKSYTDRLAKAGVDSPRLSAEVLFAAASGVPRMELMKRLILDPDAAVEESILPLADAFIARRERGEPAAYITGVKEFYGRDFAVTPATLIPRPDTETLVEIAIAFAKTVSGSAAPEFIDLGTGSGAIAVTLGLELPAWRGVAMDISSEALAVAKRNARTHGAGNIRFLHGDFCGDDFPAGPFDMIVANPPYVSEAEYADLSKEITSFEPKTALVPPVPGADGLEHLRAILAMAAPRLKKGGMMLMEIGSSQGSALTAHASASPAWEKIRIEPDLAGLPRVFAAMRA